MAKFWDKRIKNSNVIATRLGVDKDKIEELKNGEREIKGETMDRVLNVINETKAEKNLRKLEILQWYRDTDLKKLREDFGYQSQKELAKVLGCDTSTLCRFENKASRIKGATNKLEQLYYFYKDDFNRKANRDMLVVKEDEENHTNKEKDLIFEWYNNTDIKSLRGKRTLSEKAKEIGLPASTLNDIEKKRAKNLTKNIVKVYDFYNKESIIEEPPTIENEVNVNKDTYILDLEDKIKKLERQIYLYEKLIERL